MPDQDGRDAGTRRRVAVLALLVLAGAAAVAGAGSLTWWHQQHLDVLAGSISTTATGSQTDALLVPTALVGLAGFGAALATTGLLRRLVGLLLLVGGGVTAVRAIVGATSAPARLLTALSRPAESSSAPTLSPFGAVLGVLGGLAIAIAGVLLLLGYGARRALGSRYDAPTSRRARAAAEPADPSAGHAADPADDADAAAQWWKALDAGLDPTDAASAGRRPTEPPAPRTVEPGMSGDVPRGGYHDSRRVEVSHQEID